MVPALRSYAPLPPQLLKGPISLHKPHQQHVALHQYGRPAHAISQECHTKLWEPNDGGSTSARIASVSTFRCASSARRAIRTPTHSMGRRRGRQRRHGQEIFQRYGDLLRAMLLWQGLTNLKFAASTTNPAPLTSLLTTTPQTHRQTQIPTPSPTTARQGLLGGWVERAADGHINMLTTIVRTSTITARALVPRKSTSANGGSQAQMPTRRCRSRRSKLRSSW